MASRIDANQMADDLDEAAIIHILMLRHGWQEIRRWRDPIAGTQISIDGHVLTEEEWCAIAAEMRLERWARSVCGEKEV